MPRRTPSAARLPTALACMLGMLAILPTAVAARQAEPVSQDTLAAAGGVSPRGAFLRAMAVPGWGHASIRSYNRGAVYFMAETTSLWMFAKSRSRLLEARRRVDARELFLREGAALEGIEDPVALQELLDADEELLDLQGLEEARRQQREDWAALGIFLMLLSGADAYVSSHLKDFPTPIDIAAVPAGDGRMELRVGIRLPR